VTNVGLHVLGACAVYPLLFRRGLAASPTDEGLRTQLGVAMSRAGG
jgi:hypothetical protein